ncbi:MAG: Sec-independent protein translocase subunit TatA [Pseudomonadota bacterium]
MGLSFWHLVVVLVIVMLLFGTKRLGNIGSDLGNAIKGFKKAMNEDDEKAKTEQPQAKVEQKADNVIDVTPEKKKDQA